jgi:hypothetical protein
MKWRQDREGEWRADLMSGTLSQILQCKSITIKVRRKSPLLHGTAYWVGLYAHELIYGYEYIDGNDMNARVTAVDLVRRYVKHLLTSVEQLISVVED